MFVLRCITLSVRNVFSVVHTQVESKSVFESNIVTPKHHIPVEGGGNGMLKDYNCLSSMGLVLDDCHCDLCCAKGSFSFEFLGPPLYALQIYVVVH